MPPSPSGLRRERLWRPGRLSRGTLLTTFGLALRAGLQAAYLVILSRWLGAEGYGLYAGSVAAVILLAPLSGWGMGYVFAEYLPHSAQASRSLWRAVAGYAAANGALITIAAVLVAYVFLSVRLPFTDIVLVAVGELLALPLAQISTAALFAQDRSAAATTTVCLVPAFRLLGPVVLILFGIPASVHAVAVTHCIGSIAGGALALWSATRAARSGDLAGTTPLRSRALFREGAPYAVAAFTGSAYFEVDKVLVLQILGAQVAGLYTAAFRLVSVLILPLNALVSNALPRMFAVRDGPEGARLLKWVVASAVGYSILGMACAMLAAPFVPWLLGAEYRGASRFVAMFAAWVPLFALHVCGANALLAAGGKNARVVVESAGLLAAVVLNMLLLPKFGAEGGIFVLVSVEAFLAAACWLLFVTRKRAART